MTASTLEQSSVPTNDDQVSSHGTAAVDEAVTEAITLRSALQESPRLPALRRHPFQAVGWLLQGVWGMFCVMGLLAVAATIPLLNVLALGYLMEIQGRVAQTGKFRAAFLLLPAARRLGGILVAVSLWLWPIHLLAGIARDSWLLAPGETAAWIWTSILGGVSLLVAVHLVMAVGTGGAWWRFLRPIHNARALRVQVGTGEYWQVADRALREFIAAFRLPHLLSLGLLGYATAYVWLLVPAFLFTRLDDVTSRWQIVGFVAGGVTLTITLAWLPLLMAHVASAGRWRAMFELRTVGRLIGQTPFCWALATALLFASSTLPLLYTALFKIRIPPHDARWDLMLVFLATVIPARVLIGWVYHRATQRARPTSTWWWRIWQGINATALCAGVGAYVYFLNLAATGGELGRQAIWQFHALLLPWPF